jgi:hypothetical protein
MSAGSRKKHSNNHKQYQDGNQDHLEVSSLLAGAGNGRDVEARLGGAAKLAESIDNPPPPEDDIMGGVPGIGNEGPVTAGNADTEKQPETQPGRIAEAFSTSEVGAEGDGGHITNNVYQGRNIIAVLVRGTRESLFEPNFNESLKALVELHPIKIKGLRTGFKIGELSKTQTRVMATASVADFTWLERQDRVIDTTMHHWGDRYNDYLLDEEQARDNRSYKAKISLQDVTIDVVFFETDATHTRVLAAWKGMNLRPVHYTGLLSARDVGGYPFGNQCVTATLDGTYVRNPAVLAEAQALLDGVRLQCANPCALT